tara:strand:+ start:1112 stop:1714 length:603 start_codon:yes stop_codon:yes gene_type:complete
MDETKTCSLKNLSQEILKYSKDVKLQEDKKTSSELINKAKQDLEEKKLHEIDGLSFKERKEKSKKILVPFFRALANLMEEERLPQRSIQRSGEFFCKFQWQAQLPSAPEEDRCLELCYHEFNEDNFTREDLLRFMSLGWYMSVCNGPLPPRPVPLGLVPPPPTNLIDAQNYVDNNFPLVEGPQPKTMSESIEAYREKNKE